MLARIATLEVPLKTRKADISELAREFPLR